MADYKVIRAFEQLGELYEVGDDWDSSDPATPDLIGQFVRPKGQSWGDVRPPPAPTEDEPQPEPSFE